MTRGMPRSTQATRLLVVPRSMPTMRGMRRQLLSEGIGEVLDDGPEIRPRGQALLEPPEQGGAVAAGVDGRVPVAPPRDDRRLLARATVDQPLPLLGEPGPRGRREAVGLGLLERLLHLEHLLEQIARRHRARRRALPRLPPLLEGDQVLDPAEIVAEGAVRPVHEGRLLEGLALALRRGAL